MKLGVFSYSYHLAFGKHDIFKPSQPITIFDFMEKMARLGVDGIQIDIMHLESAEDAYLEKVADFAKERNLTIEYGSTGIEDEHMLRELQIAHKLGAKLMRTFMGFNRYDHSVDAKEVVDQAIKTLAEVEGTAKELGILIAVENHCDATVDEMLKIMKRIDSDQIGICVDLGNFMIHQEKPIDSVKKLAPYIINTHFKDYNMEMMNWGFKAYGVPLGQGVIDLKGIFEILVNESKIDQLMLEIPVEPVYNNEIETLEKEDTYVTQSIEYARNILGIG